MLAASSEVPAQHFGDEPTDDSVANIEISIDVAWQRRGYASLNGLVTVVAIDTNRCVDFEVLSKPTKFWRKMAQGTYEYYDCCINHQDSAGSCFKLSVEKNRLRYTTYIVNGIGKDECVSHVQKRVGALSKFKKDMSQPNFLMAKQ